MIGDSFDQAHIQELVTWFVGREEIYKRAAVHRTTNQSINTATATPISWSQELSDTDAMVDIAGNPTRITIVTPGWYNVTGYVEWAANATGRRIAAIRLNGTTILADVAGPAVAEAVSTRQTPCWQGELTVGDYLELVVTQASGGALNVLSSGAVSPFTTPYFAANRQP